MPIPIDPSFLTSGPEWNVGAVDGAQAAPQTGSGFGDMLGKSLQSLADSQTEASKLKGVFWNTRSCGITNTTGTSSLMSAIGPCFISPAG